ncbi:hypothetical protein, partial [Bacillus cereus]
YILVYIHFPSIIDFIPITLISSKTARKVYIQNTVNKENKKHLINIKKNTTFKGGILFYISI